MARDVDDRKKRAALRKLRKAAELAEQGLGPPLSDWEVEFLEEVEERIEKFGSAFADPEKGGNGEALSALQQIKLKEIDKKARGKGTKSSFGNKGGFKSKSSTSGFKPRSRDINDEIDIEPGDAPPPEQAPPPRGFKPELIRASDMPDAPKSSGMPKKTPETPQTAPKKPAFRVITGGKSD